MLQKTGWSNPLGAFRWLSVRAHDLSAMPTAVIDFSCFRSLVPSPWTDCEHPYVIVSRWKNIQPSEGQEFGISRGWKNIQPSEGQAFSLPSVPSP